MRNPSKPHAHPASLPSTRRRPPAHPPPSHRPQSTGTPSSPAPIRAPPNPTPRTESKPQSADPERAPYKTTKRTAARFWEVLRRISRANAAGRAGTHSQLFIPEQPECRSLNNMIREGIRLNCLRSLVVVSLKSPHEKSERPKFTCGELSCTWRATPEGALLPRSMWRPQHSEPAAVF